MLGRTVSPAHQACWCIASFCNGTLSHWGRSAALASLRNRSGACWLDWRLTSSCSRAPIALGGCSGPPARAEAASTSLAWQAVAAEARPAQPPQDVSRSAARQARRMRIRQPTQTARWRRWSILRVAAQRPAGPPPSPRVLAPARDSGRGCAALAPGWVTVWRTQPALRRHLRRLASRLWRQEDARFACRSPAALLLAAPRCRDCSNWSVSGPCAWSWPFRAPLHRLFPPSAGRWQQAVVPLRAEQSPIHVRPWTDVIRRECHPRQSRGC